MVFWKAGFLWLTENGPWFCCHFVQTSQENGWAQGLLYIKWSLNMVAWKMNSGGSLKNLTKPYRSRKRKKKRKEQRRGKIIRWSIALAALQCGGRVQWDLYGGSQPVWGDPMPSSVLCQHQVLMWYINIHASKTLTHIKNAHFVSFTNEPSVISVEGNLIHDVFIKQTAYSSSNGFLSHWTPSLYVISWKRHWLFTTIKWRLWSGQ